MVRRCGDVVLQTRMKEISPMIATNRVARWLSTTRGRTENKGVTMTLGFLILFLICHIFLDTYRCFFLKLLTESCLAHVAGSVKAR